MAIVKQYITWQRLWNGSKVGTDVSANINNNWNYPGREITCTELPYGYVAGDKRLLAIVEYNDADYEADVLQRMWDAINPWVYCKVTPIEAVALCNDWYPSEGEAYFTLDTDGFTIIDGRPVEEL